MSPCVLPMLPLYLSYFMGGEDVSDAASRRKGLVNLSGFILGFTTIFVMLGALAGMLGSMLIANQNTLNLVTGSIVILLGLFYMGIIRIRPIEREFMAKASSVRITGFLSSVVFGLVFGLAWTPCVGPVLAALLAISANQGNIGSGVGLLLMYSAGLALPFILSTLFLEQLKGAFDFIRRNFTAFRRVSGSVLVVVGVLMSTGHLHQVLLFTTNL